MDEVSQGPTPSKKTLAQTVASIMREDIQPPYNGKLSLRQPPINEDDSDSWSGEWEKPEKWLFVAESVIRAIDRYRSRNEA